MTLNVSATEQGGVRVFALSMDAHDARRLRDDPRAMASALGVDMDPAQAEVIAIDDLEGVGLIHYLIEGMGIPPARVEPDRAKLAALDGHVLIVLSAAFGGQTVTLTPVPEVTLIGAYRQDLPDWTPAPVTSESAKPYAEPSVPEAPSAPRKTHWAQNPWLSLGMAAGLLVLGWLLLR